MPSLERDPADRDPSPASEFEPRPYQRASRFAGERPAGRAYTAAQQVIYEAPDSDLSVYRLQLNQLWYVAALGLVPPAPVLQAIEQILDRGEPADLPAEVWHTLQERRRHATRLGPWVERHQRPGEPP
jgi:hypothetical protein